MELSYIPNGGSLVLNSDKCTGCGMCVEVCPHAVFLISDKKAQIAEPAACMECGACGKNCPAGAIKVSSGVGCAAAIIAGFIRKTEPTCDCGGPGSNQKSCC